MHWGGAHQCRSVGIRNPEAPPLSPSFVGEVSVVSNDEQAARAVGHHCGHIGHCSSFPVGSRCSCGRVCAFQGILRALACEGTRLSVSGLNCPVTWTPEGGSPDCLTWVEG